MHSIHLLLASGGPTTSDGLKIAIIGAVGIVLAAAIPAWLSTREKIKERQSSREPDYKSLLNDAVRQRDTVQRKLDELRLQYTEETAKEQNNIDRLERIIWRLGYDPSTGRPNRRHSDNQNPP